MTRDELNEALGWTVSRETFERLEKYHDLLIEWSKTHNLIGPKEVPYLWDRHILDCLQIWPHVKQAKTVLDIGSGAGLPGIVLACCAAEIRGMHVILVESNGKRCAFLRHVSRRLGLPVEICHERVEDVSRETVDVVTARAVAELSDLMKYSQKWLLKGTRAVFPKGRTWSDELTDAHQYWNFKMQIFPSKSASDGVILSLSEVTANHA